MYSGEPVVILGVLPILPTCIYIYHFCFIESLIKLFITFNCTLVFLIFVYLLKILIKNLYLQNTRRIYMYSYFIRNVSTWLCSMTPSVILLSVCVPRWCSMINWSRSITSASVLHSVFKDRASIWSIYLYRRCDKHISVRSTFRNFYRIAFIACSRRPWKCLLNLWMYVRIVYPERNNPWSSIFFPVSVLLAVFLSRATDHRLWRGKARGKLPPGNVEGLAYRSSILPRGG